jgi:hypothetical protein
MGYKDLKDRAEKAGARKSLTPKFLELRTPGEEIVGRFMGTHEMPPKRGSTTYNQYIFDTDDGPVKFSMGANADKEILPSMVHGGVYCVRFDGAEEIEGGNSVNKWNVSEIKEDVLSDPTVPGK